jgi:deoxyribonuclease-4
MPLFGAHMSIAGGHFHAIEKAQPYRCEAVQLFTKSTNQWRAKDLSDEEVALFRKKYSESRLQMAMGHDSYLINLASPNEALYRNSIESFILE